MEERKLEIIITETDEKTSYNIKGANIKIVDLQECIIAIQEAINKEIGYSDRDGVQMGLIHILFRRYGFDLVKMIEAFPEEEEESDED